MNIYVIIVSIISALIMCYGLIYSFSKLCNKKINLSFKNLIIIFVLCIAICINNYFNVATFKIISALVLTVILEKLLFKIELKDTFILVVILTLISIIIEFLLSPIAAIFITDINNLNDNATIKTIYSIINTVFLMLIISNNLLNKYINKLRNIIKNFINYYTISIILICAFNIIMYMYGYNYRNIRFLIVVIIFSILLLTCFRIIVNDKYNNLLLKEKNKALKDEYKAYSNTIDECKELKHNLKNELYSLKVKLPKEEQNIINSIITKYNRNYEWINTLIDIPEGLQGLIYLKINEAKKKKINIFLNIKSSLKTSENDYLDISVILGILIDNAIEASVIAKSKSIVMNITKEENIINIQIINRFKNLININEIGNKNYSTKEYKSGLGINFIKKIKKQNIKVNFKITNDLFITTLSYNKKNESNN